MKVELEHQTCIKKEMYAKYFLHIENADYNGRNWHYIGHKLMRYE